MLKRRWNRFMCPNGIRRTFNPRKWEHGTSVLVFGEVLAVCAAVAAIPGTAFTQWFLYAAAIIASGALAWYALDKSSLGEMPLTGVSAKRIANVVRLVNTEEKLGPVLNWDTITADGKQAEMDLTKANPEHKRRLARALLVDAAQQIPAEELPPSVVADQIQISESDVDRILEALVPPGLPFIVGNDHRTAQDPNSA